MSAIRSDLLADVPAELPSKPEPPVGYDCCGGGCADCELRLYIERMREWQRLRDTLSVSGTDPRS